MTRVCQLSEAWLFSLVQFVVMGALLQTEAKRAERDVQPEVPTLAETTSRQRAIEALNCLPVDRLPVWLLHQSSRCLPNFRSFKTQYSFRQLVRKLETDYGRKRTVLTRPL